jgi:hypothetical protein
MSAGTRGDWLSDDSYEDGPWELNHRYLQECIEERLSEELTDLDAWLSPSDSEMHLRNDQPPPPRAFQSVISIS